VPSAAVVGCVLVVSAVPVLVAGAGSAAIAVSSSAVTSLMRAVSSSSWSSSIRASRAW